MKNLYLSIILLLLTLQATAQKLSKDDIKNFKAVALFPNTLTDPTPIIRKWTIPICYKIYGSSDADYTQAVHGGASGTFAQLRTLTDLDIRKVDSPDSVNFTIIVGDYQKYASAINPGALNYFKGHKGNQTYYTSNANGINSVILVVDPQTYSSKAEVRSVLQIQLVWALGFFGKLDTNNSVFSTRPQTLPFYFKPADAERIKTLYNKQILYGMKEPQLDEVLKQIE
jgi:hypothetical protein